MVKAYMVCHQNVNTILQNVPPTAVLMTSIYGQQYQCSYPDPHIKDEKEKEEEKAAEEAGILELLKPMESSPCIIYVSKLLNSFVNMVKYKIYMQLFNNILVSNRGVTALQ